MGPPGHSYWRSRHCRSGANIRTGDPLDTENASILGTLCVYVNEMSSAAKDATKNGTFLCSR